MNITLYTISCPRKQVDKTSNMTQVASYEGTLREKCSISLPSVLVQSSGLPQANYAYIPEFNRYYFISDIIAETNTLFRINMVVDVLMTDKTNLLTHTAIITRNQYASLKTSLLLEDTKVEHVADYFDSEEIFSVLNPVDTDNMVWVLVVGTSYNKDIGYQYNASYSIADTPINSPKINPIALGASVNVYVCKDTAGKNYAFAKWFQQNICTDADKYSGYIYSLYALPVSLFDNSNLSKNDLSGGDGSDIVIGGDHWTIDEPTYHFVPYLLQGNEGSRNLQYTIKRYYNGDEILRTMWDDDDWYGTDFTYLSKEPYTVIQVHIPSYGNVTIPINKLFDNVTKSMIPGKYAIYFTITLRFDLTNGSMTVLISGGWYDGNDKTHILTNEELVKFECYPFIVVPYSFSNIATVTRQNEIYRLQQDQSLITGILGSVSTGTKAVGSIVSGASQSTTAAVQMATTGTGNPASGVSELFNGVAGLVDTASAIVNTVYENQIYEAKIRNNVPSGTINNVGSTYGSLLSEYEGLAILLYQTSEYYGENGTKSKYEELYGRPCYNQGILSSFSGYTECKVRYTSTKLFSEEMRAMEQILQNGIILP